jgi:hypothetical protein
LGFERLVNAIGNLLFNRNFGGFAPAVARQEFEYLEVAVLDLMLRFPYLAADALDIQKVLRPLVLQLADLRQLRPLSRFANPALHFLEGRRQVEDAATKPRMLTRQGRALRQGCGNLDGLSFFLVESELHFAEFLASGLQRFLRREEIRLKPCTLALDVLALF